MKDSVKTLLKIVGIVLTVVGVACVILSFVEKLPDLKQLTSRRPKEYDDYADVD